MSELLQNYKNYDIYLYDFGLQKNNPSSRKIQWLSLTFNIIPIYLFIFLFMKLSYNQTCSSNRNQVYDFSTGFWIVVSIYQSFSCKSSNILSSVEHMKFRIFTLKMIARGAFEDRN